MPSERPTLDAKQPRRYPKTHNKRSVSGRGKEREGNERSPFLGAAKAARATAFRGGRLVRASFFGVAALRPADRTASATAKLHGSGPGAHAAGCGSKIRSASDHDNVRAGHRPAKDSSGANHPEIRGARSRIQKRARQLYVHADGGGANG